MSNKIRNKNGVPLQFHIKKDSEIKNRVQLNKNRVRILRSLWNVSQPEFAEIYNIPLATIRFWESDCCKNSPKDYILDLMEYYYISEKQKENKEQE